MRIAATLIVSVLFCGLPALGQDQTDANSTTTETTPESFHYEQWADYRVGGGDTLEIQVADVPELTQTVDVSSTGEITIHPVGTMKVLDMTAGELEDAVAAAFQQKGLLKDPQVLVYVRHYRAKKIYVTGELAFPGEFVISKGLTVLDGILLAGGVGPAANRFAYIHRRTSASSVTVPPSANIIEHPETAREGVEILRVDLQPLKEGKAPVPDLQLQAGDYLIVPRRSLEFYYVMGEVVRPLDYLLPRDRPLRVSQAIAGAGGPTNTAKVSEGILIRTDAEGERQEIQVNFTKIIKGEQEDIVVQPNDVIFIPGSIIKTIGEGYVRAANAMIAGAAFRIGRSYQLPNRSSRASTPPDQLPN